MPSKKPPALRDLFQALLTGATASGEDRALTLSHGARLAVRVREGVTTVSIARCDKPVGDREEITFRAQCAFPAGAERIPETGQRQVPTTDGATWYQVAYRWRQE